MNKKTESLNSDITNTLPQNIIENILSLIPLRDALRTSVLSKKWRYIWRSMPKLVFTDNLVIAHYPRTMQKYKLVNAIFHVLLLHNGPTILVFDCCVNNLVFEIVSEFEQILSYLSRENKVKELTFHNDYRSYKLPASFFSLQGLERIRLKRCTFEPPLTYNRFSCLTCLVFINVEVSAQMLRRFLSKCPLLEHIQLVRSICNTPKTGLVIKPR
ncbi:putative F-box domain-containing protein [Helianthus debilis subsp. tardiflorus]